MMYHGYAWIGRPADKGARHSFPCPSMTITDDDVMPIEKARSSYMRTYGRGYDPVPRDISELGISAEALGIWLYLYGKPSTWVIRENDVRSHFPKLGRHRYQSAVRELKAAGLWSNIITREKGVIVANTSKVTHDHPGVTYSKECGGIKPTAADHSFYNSREWLDLRYKVLAESNRRCECCGKSPKDGISLHVDHIKPRSKYPELELCAENLQILCSHCNYGKGNSDEVDYRE